MKSNDVVCAGWLAGDNIEHCKVWFDTDPDLLPSGVSLVCSQSRLETGIIFVVSITMYSPLQCTAAVHYTSKYTTYGSVQNRALRAMTKQPDQVGCVGKRRQWSLVVTTGLPGQKDSI